MINHDQLQASLKSINEALSISLKARELRDIGLLDRGDDVITQSAKLGELMWRHLWKHVADGCSSNNDIDRGETLVVKKQSSSRQDAL